MSGELVFRNHPPARAVDLRALRPMVRRLIQEHLQESLFELGIHFVAAPEMSRLNETFLRHAGSTDVITFDYSERTGSIGPALHGEIFICMDEARAQARRFRTSWQAEVARYIIHGVLHLRGLDDARPADRRKMKREEERLLGEMSRRFDLKKIARRKA